MAKNKTAKRRALSAAPPTGHMGELGTDRGVIDITFGWFGHDIRVNPGAGELELMEFLIESDGIEVGDDADLNKSVPAMKAVFDFLQAQIHPDDWKIFFDLAKTHRQNTMDLMQVAMAIVERVSNLPTGPSGGSGRGTAPTNQKSTDGLSSPDSRRLALARQALAAVPATRPDLAEAYIMAAEAGR